MNVSEKAQKVKFKIGFALSGGGIKGLCHAGVLKALEEFEIFPDVISGVSAGAIVGALYADGYSPDEIAAMFQDISFRKMTNFHIPEGGLFGMDAFEEFLSKTLRAKTFEDLKIPLRIVATDLDKGITKVFDQGKLLEPILASCSVPLLFKPRKINNVNYVDGGVLKNFPVSTIRYDCEQVIGINASPLVADEYKLTLLNVASRTYHFMFKSNILADKEMCDFLIEPIDMGNYDTFDTDKAREIYDLGYSSTKLQLKSINQNNEDILNNTPFKKKLDAIY